MSIESMKQALDALTNLQPILANGLLTDAQLKFIDPHINVAMTKLRQAIEIAGKQEPVALQVYRGEICYKSDYDDQSYGMWCPVTPAFPPRFPEGTKFYTAPPKREWQGLTDEDIDILQLGLMREYRHGTYALARAIEKLLKEKNYAAD